jgi:Lrp/AsnC family transcriptional regulator, leucine-responsive regulatory protein
MPDLVFAYNQGPGGNIRVIAALKAFHQLDEIKDKIKQRFSILDVKSVIWTDIKEMNSNLDILSEKPPAEKDFREKTPKTHPLPKNPIKIDEVDLKIADMLSSNGQLSLSKIAEKIGISTNSVTKRYNNLKKNGAMKVIIQFDPRKIGYHALAIFYITFALKAESSLIIDQISRIPNIISIMKTSGDYDLTIYAMIKDLGHLLSLQSEFAQIPDIAKMTFDIGELMGIWPLPRQCVSTF